MKKVIVAFCAAVCMLGCETTPKEVIYPDLQHKWIWDRTNDGTAITKTPANQGYTMSYEFFKNMTFTFKRDSLLSSGLANYTQTAGYLVNSGTDVTIEIDGSVYYMAFNTSDTLVLSPKNNFGRNSLYFYRGN